MENFVNWLLKEMNVRGMSQADLARSSGLSRTAISKIISGSRDPGPDACTGIASAFNFPPDIVFRKAGLLPEKEKEPPDLLELNHRFMGASDEVRKEILEFVRFKTN